jgi:hypothetical protein
MKKQILKEKQKEKSLCDKCYYNNYHDCPAHAPDVELDEEDKENEKIVKCARFTTGATQYNW